MLTSIQYNTKSECFAFDRALFIPSASISLLVSLIPAVSKKSICKFPIIIFDKITSQAISIGVGIVPAIEIDRINILESTYKAMKMSLGKLNPVPEEALIDGFPLNTQIIPNRGIIKGDETIDVIKAASIIAKVTRDRIMVKYDQQYPLYGFKKHKGYGTKEHLKMLQKN